MSEFSKAEYVSALMVLLDMPETIAPQLKKLSVTTLAHIYEGLVKNARAYKELEDRSYFN